MSRTTQSKPVAIVDHEVEDAMARSFLGKLPAELVTKLLGEGERVDVPAGSVVYREGSAPRAGLVVTGLVRVYMSSSQGRQITVRYARPSDVIGIVLMVGGPGNFSVQTVEASSLLRINLRTLLGAAHQDAKVAWAIAEELDRRLFDTIQQAATNAFGSVKQRVAIHLLDLASAQQRPSDRLRAHVSQQELADAVGSVREVVARVLREFRLAGVVATSSDGILILDPPRLYAESS